MDQLIDEKRIHHGHRSRMRAKLQRHGGDIFDTYELLEMLLYQVIPYRDTNPLAKQLLMKFGSLDGVLSAERDELTAIDGIGEFAADFIVNAGSCMALLGVSHSAKEEKKFNVYSEVGEYFTTLFSENNGPRVALLLLDNNMHLIRCDTLYDLDYDSAAVTPKSFIDCALRNRASVAISAHSHPHGPLFPTEGDRATNLLVTNTLKSVGVNHLEHYVVSGDRYIGIMNSGWQGLRAYTPVEEFYLTKLEQIRLGIVEDPSKYFTDY